MNVNDLLTLLLKLSQDVESLLKTSGHLNTSEKYLVVEEIEKLVAEINPEPANVPVTNS